MGLAIWLVLRALQILIHLSFTPSVTVQVLLFPTFYTGKVQSTERMNKLAEAVKQGFKPTQSENEVNWEWWDL